MAHSQLPQRQTYEPPLRFMVTNLEQSQTRLALLPVTNFSHLINDAHQGMEKAAKALRQWAEAHDIELHDTMPT